MSLHHWVEQARERADYADVKRVASDETAAKRGHDYVSLFVDIDQRRVCWLGECLSQTIGTPGNLRVSRRGTQVDHLASTPLRQMALHGFRSP